MSLSLLNTWISTPPQTAIDSMIGDVMCLSRKIGTQPVPGACQHYAIGWKCGCWLSAEYGSHLYQLPIVVETTITATLEYDAAHALIERMIQVCVHRMLTLYPYNEGKQ